MRIPVLGKDGVKAAQITLLTEAIKKKWNISFQDSGHWTIKDNDPWNGGKVSFPVIFRGGARLWRTDVELKQSSEHLEQMESTVHKNQGDSQGSAPERDSAAQGEYRAAVSMNKLPEDGKPPKGWEGSAQSNAYSHQLVKKTSTHTAPWTGFRMFLFQSRE